MAHSPGQHEAYLITDSGLPIATKVELADTWWKRFKGLQFRKPQPDEHAILLRPCSSIHTFWMRFSIDVVFIDEASRAIEVVRAVRPWRVVIPGTRSVAVLEMTSGSLPEQLTAGDALQWSTGERVWPLLESPPVQPDES